MTAPTTTSPVLAHGARLLRWLALPAVAVLAGCAGGPELGRLIATGSLLATVQPTASTPAAVSPAAAPSGAATPAGTTPAPASASTPATPAGGGATPGPLSLAFAPDLARIEVAPLEVYSRIARHARGCWFGADGVLEASHVFHADAKPADKGGGVIVTIHDRIIDASSIWGARAFEIALNPSGEGTSIAMENVKLADTRAQAIMRDVEAWMYERPGCALRTVEPAGAVGGPPLPGRRPKIATARPARRSAR